MSDADAIEAVKRGDKERYNELVERYQSMVYGIAWSRLGDSGLSEDAAQETFVKAFRYLVALRNPERFPAWLAKIARNVSAGVLRSRKRELERSHRWHVEPCESSPAETVTQEGESLAETLRKTLEDLPAQHRECLVLFYLEGKKIHEAAELLGISEAAMKTRLHRARLDLRGRLEEKIESSLSELRPSNRFTQGVMSVLPPMPFATFGVGGTSAVATTLGVLGKLLAWIPFAFFMGLYQGTVGAIYLGWLGKLEADNLVPGRGKNFRRRIISGNVAVLVISGTLAVLISFMIMVNLGPFTLFKLLVPFCVWGTYSAARLLRVNRCPYTIGNVLANATFGITFLLIGFFHAPFWIFFLAMLLLNIGPYHTNKTRPIRHDYNLFLRQASGLLGDSGPSSQEVRCLTKTEKLAFVRFLGERFLVKDYVFTKEGLKLFLPPVKPGLVTSLGFMGSNSTVQIQVDGRYAAHLGDKDLRDLCAIIDEGVFGKEYLEEKVAEVVRAALRCFVNGQSVQAELLLQTENDAQVFVTPIATSKEHRIRSSIAIAATLFLLIGGWWYYDPAGQIKKPQTHVVKPKMAGYVLNQWIQAYPQKGDFKGFLCGEALPPWNYFIFSSKPGLNAAIEASYKDAVITYLRGEDSTDLTARVIRLLNEPRGLYNILKHGILTEKRIERLGLSPDKVREVLQGHPEDTLTKMNQSTYYDASDSTGKLYRVKDIDTIAYRLACLKALGCLDLVDGDALAKEIAAQQITKDWQNPPNYAPVNIEKATGLFHFGWCDLRGTRGALWALEMLGKVDCIDKESCKNAILRFYKGNAFQADNIDDNIAIWGTDDDKFFAMESFYILGGLDSIKDFNRWSFEPVTIPETRDGKTDYVVTPQSIVVCAYQLRLEELQRKVPKTP